MTETILSEFTTNAADRGGFFDFQSVPFRREFLAEMRLTHVQIVRHLKGCNLRNGEPWPTVVARGLTQDQLDLTRSIAERHGATMRPLNLMDEKRNVTGREEPKPRDLGRSSVVGQGNEGLSGGLPVDPR